MQELSRLTTEQMSKVHELQLNTGFQPSQNSDDEELTVLEQEKGSTRLITISELLLVLLLQFLTSMKLYVLFQKRIMQCS